jgi:hypothetical protein
MTRRRNRSRFRGGPLARVGPALATSLLLAAAVFWLVAQGPDFENYATLFQLLRADPWETALEQRFEPLFSFAAATLSRLLTSDALVFAGLMLVSLWLKLYSIGRSSATRSIALVTAVFYVTRFLPLHELVQVRVALAIGLLMLAVVLCQRRVFWILLLAAVLTHYSTVVMVPILWAWRWLNLSPATYLRWEGRLWLSAVAAAASIGLVTQVFLEPLSLIFVALEMYRTAGFGDDSVNLLSLSVLVDVFFLVPALLLSKGRPRALFWLYLQVIGLVLFVALQDLPVLAHRIREMFNVFWVFYILVSMERRGVAGLWPRVMCMVSVPTYFYLYFVGSNALFPL